MNNQHINRWGPLVVPTCTTKLSAASSSSNTDQQDTADTTTTVNGAEEECVKTADVLSLDSIRSTLIRQEETIIFALIERSQFRRNSRCYQKGGFGASLGVPPGSNMNDTEELSFMEYMLIGTVRIFLRERELERIRVKKQNSICFFYSTHDWFQEALHCCVRRYTSPEEHAFFPDRLPTPLQALPQLDYPSLLDEEASQINFNPILMKKYIDTIVPSLTRPGDDEQHGSTVLADIQVLQALSRRVHYGKFVAESKYRADPAAYQKLVEANDADGVMELLTNSKVEEQVLRRARLKAATYGREPLKSLPPHLMEELGSSESSNDSVSIVAAAAASAVVAAVEAMGDKKEHHDGKVDPAVIESVYRDIVIPLTKDVEVAYLFRRCGKEPPPEYGPDRMSIDAKVTP